MSPLEIGLVSFVIGFVLLAAGVWISVALMATALLSLWLFSPAPLLKVAGTALWSGSASWTLAALPLYVWMGEILFRTNISRDLFRSIAPWVTAIPGRLLHANVIGCGIFAAVSGSSAATAATIGSISLPELSKRGYPESISIGSLAGAGTLGLLIPPSIVMIVYGVAANVSIVQLFVAGIIPGIALMMLFSGYIAVWALANPNLMPPREPSLSLFEKMKQTWRVLPTIGLIVAVIGSIYTSIATATEAAALGCIGALVLSAVSRSMSFRTFWESLSGAVLTSGMIGFILAASSLLTSALAYSGVPNAFAAWVASLGLSSYALIAALCLLYIVLGCVIDGLSMIVLTASIVLPTVNAAGFDLLWFGIFVVLVVEMAQITPPVGFNLFVIQALTGKDIFTVTRYSIPFFFLLLAMAAISTAFPSIILWLPTTVLK